MLSLSSPSHSKLLYSLSALYATTTAFAAFWIGIRLPLQHDTVGPYRYHRALKWGMGRRGLWRRVPRLL
jgi:hypothetical protein